MDDLEHRLDEALAESFPASDPVAVTAEPEPWDNEEFHRFEMDTEGDKAVLRYMKRDGVLQLTHTEVPEAFRGRGYARQLTQFALESARQEGLKVRPVCPYVRQFLDKNPGYEEMVAE